MRFDVGAAFRRAARATTSRRSASCASPLAGRRDRAAGGAGRRRARRRARASINRENGQRYIGIRMNVRGRDLGSFVARRRRASAQQRQLPGG